MYCCLSGERADRQKVSVAVYTPQLFHFLGHRWNNSNLLPMQNGVYLDAFGRSRILCDGFQMYKELPVIIYYSRSSEGFHRCKIPIHTFLKTFVHLATVHLFVIEMLYHHDIPCLSQNLSVFMAQPVLSLQRCVHFISHLQSSSIAAFLLSWEVYFRDLGAWKRELGFCRVKLHIILLKLSSTNCTSRPR